MKLHRAGSSGMGYFHGEGVSLKSSSFCHTHLEQVATVSCGVLGFVETLLGCMLVTSPCLQRAVPLALFAFSAMKPPIRESHI